MTNKKPTRVPIIYDSPGGFDASNGFIFSEELPYKRKTIKDYQKEYKRKKENNVRDKS